jgi:hypothetical protein
LLDFSLTRDEIKEILPPFAHLVERAISGISPVLVEDVGHGGLRVHHESFRTYIREKLEADPQANLEAILRPVIEWLDARGFFKDTRAFRSVLRLLERSGRIDELLSRGGLPLGYPYPKMWQPFDWKKIAAPDSFGGPIAALGFKRDAFSRIEFLAPLVHRRRRRLPGQGDICRRILRPLWHPSQNADQFIHES